MISAFISRGVAAVGGVSGGAGGVGRSVEGDASMFSSGAVDDMVVGVVAGKSGDGGGRVSCDGNGDLIVDVGDVGEKVGGETSRGKERQAGTGETSRGKERQAGAGETSRGMERQAGAHSDLIVILISILQILKLTGTGCLIK